MSDRDFPFGFVLTTVGVIAWIITHPVQARAAPAAPFRVVCPQSLPAGMVPMHERADGWTVSVPEGRQIDGAGMLHGAPDEQAYLKPASGETTMRGKRAVSVTRWTFDLPHWYETWVYCGYGSVELARRIPVTATECTVTFEREGARTSPTIFTCR